MAKGKKGKKGKKEKKEVDPNQLTEVDKTFYELQITDLNRKLARLRSLTKELEEKNEELVEQNKKLDEDHGDIIMFLKRTLQEKADEMIELQERLKATQEMRQEETQKFLEKIEDMEIEYRQMHEQLTSEIKLLAGKLNSLEEFRVQRDELMRKFDAQAKAMQEQEIRHKRELYEIERKFIIGKDKLKKEMEARLLQLSTEFQDATEIRIAATTHRVIRENIAINNELELMLQSHHGLVEQNDQLRNRDRELRLNSELRESETKKAQYKNFIQYKLIHKLTDEYEQIKQQLETHQNTEKEVYRVSKELTKSKQTIEKRDYTIRLLEQNLHHSRCERTTLQTELLYLRDEYSRLSDILFQAVTSIQDALDMKLDMSSGGGEGIDEVEALNARENLLSTLLTIMSRATEQRPRKPSLESIDSMTATYKRGDLGFVPKPVELRTKIPCKRTIASQVDESFEEYLKMYQEKPEETDDKDIQMALLSDPNMLRDYLRDIDVSICEEESIVSATLFEGLDEASSDSEEAVAITDLNLSTILRTDEGENIDDDGEQTSATEFLSIEEQESSAQAEPPTDTSSPEN